MPEVLEVHVVPSDEVSKVPEAPTSINSGLEVGVVLLVSLFLAQEMTVRLKRDMRIMYKTLFILLLYTKSKILFVGILVD